MKLYDIPTLEYKRFFDDYDPKTIPAKLPVICEPDFLIFEQPIDLTRGKRQAFWVFRMTNEGTLDFLGKAWNKKHFSQRKNKQG